MIRTGMAGLGKMGLSHLSTARAHPEIDLFAGCVASTNRSSAKTSTRSAFACAAE